MAAVNTTAPAPYDIDTLALAELAVAAEQGDGKALLQLKAQVDTPEFWVAWEEQTLDVAAAAERSLLTLIVGERLASREGIKAKLSAMRADLGGPSPSPLERLLVARVVLCWLRLQQAEFADVRVEQMGATRSELEYHGRRVDRAHKRFLLATRSLATVRRAQLPTVQVNVAKRQVNLNC